MRDLLAGLKLGRAHGGDQVHLARSQRRDFGAGIVAEIDEHEFIEIGRAVPVILARREGGTLADLIFHQLERASAVQLRGEGLALFRIGHDCCVMEQMLGHRELTDLQVEPHRMVVDFLDRVRVPQAPGLLRLPVGAGGVFLVHHVAGHQTEA